MRDGWYVDDDGNHETQEMFEFDPEPTPKGLKQVLQERRLYQEGYRKKEMIAILSKQQDFVNDAEITQIRLIAYKHNKYAKVFHFPKFHCELNGIENVWMDIVNI